jgi:alpha-L-fucosidase
MTYEPNWESLKAYTVPEWFKDAKLGIFIHWGVYAVPAFDNEWYPRFMYRDEISRKGPNYFRHHLQTYGPQSEFGYKDFIPMFKAENWDPEAWIELFQAAGAGTWSPSPSTTTAFPCTPPISPPGTRPTWVPGGTSSPSWPGPRAGQD